MENENQKLASFAETEKWRVVKRIMEDIAERRYGWDREDIEISKGAHLFLRDIIRKVEGAKDSQN